MCVPHVITFVYFINEEYFVITQSSHKNICIINAYKDNEKAEIKSVTASETELNSRQRDWK